MVDININYKNKVYIIGGTWKGWKLIFPAIPQIRPTSSKARGTLFNWLAPIINGTRCLDLFAGSGALGIEARSRGAREVVLIEAHHLIGYFIRNNLKQMRIDGIKVIIANAITWLRDSKPEKFDIVLVDPPFSSNMLETTCTLLEVNGWLTNDAIIYLELSSRSNKINLPINWFIYRNHTTKSVLYLLLKRKSIQVK